MCNIKLFCIPYAGGSALIFKKWKQFLNPKIELFPIELAGRGKRINEPYYINILEAVEDIYQIVRKEIDGEPYAIFGHSMGCMYAYQLCQKIRKVNISQPEHVFFAGRRAPHMKIPDEKKYHLMNGEDFKNEVISLGGTPPELFDHPELLEIFLPLLRSDFILSEEGVNSNEIHPIDNNISVLIGKEDNLTTEEYKEWEKHTTGLCNFHIFEGGHFFINYKTERVVTLINNQLTGIPVNN